MQTYSLLREFADSWVLLFLTLVFLGVVATLLPFSAFSVAVAGAGEPVTLVVLVALLVLRPGCSTPAPVAVPVQPSAPIPAPETVPLAPIPVHRPG